MLERLRSYWRQRRGNAAVVDATLARIADAARNPSLYTRMGVADTVWGRFEMMALHVLLFQDRAKSGGEGLKAMAQDLVDAYFKELDHTIRELGIGDASVPKRMKKLGRMVYGRWSAYGSAIDAADAGALADALARNAYAEGGDADRAPMLAEYALATRHALDNLSDEALLAGRLAFRDHTSAEVA